MKQFLFFLLLTDICEDPDLKLKIAALRSEQETRARADNQKNRRSQSLAMNTRTHSVRRNSTRDKTLTSKKKIKDEAIIGIQDVFKFLALLSPSV